MDGYKQIVNKPGPNRESALRWKFTVRNLICPGKFFKAGASCSSHAAFPRFFRVDFVKNTESYPGRAESKKLCFTF